MSMLVQSVLKTQTTYHYRSAVPCYNAKLYSLLPHQAYKASSNLDRHRKALLNLADLQLSWLLGVNPFEMISLNDAIHYPTLLPLGHLQTPTDHGLSGDPYRICANPRRPRLRVPLPIGCNVEEV